MIDPAHRSRQHRPVPVDAVEIDRPRAHGGRRRRGEATAENEDTEETAPHGVMVGAVDAMRPRGFEPLASASAGLRSIP